jgi:PilZ domain
MNERRKAPRKSLMSYSQVFDLYGGQLLGYLGDLNLLGAMVIGDKPVAKGTNLTLAIELPELPGVRATRMVIPARVVWSEQDISPNFFNIGLEFMEVRPDQTSIIQAIMETYEFQRNVPSYLIKPSASQK